MALFTLSALDLLKSLEGFRSGAYQDEAGVWTVGYGHTGRDVGPGAFWTEEIASDVLQSDLDHFIAGVTTLVHRALVPLTDNQFSALVIFAYNVGLQALGGSTVLRRVNSCLDGLVPDALAEWCHIHANGLLVVSPGLQKRRQAEISLWNQKEEQPCSQT